MGVTQFCTNLGTPVTMAPELLRKTGKIFSDKIDLWSIGIVFYMMLYGIKGPFNFRTYEDLQRAVVDQSGKKLIFPNDIEVSNEAKDLLRKLIEPDPIKRISWDDFFSHKLFHNELHMSVLPVENTDLKQSCPFYPNINKVEKLWNENANTKNHVDYIEDVRDLDCEKMKKCCYTVSQSNQNRRSAINHAKSRYNHEKKIIVYLAKSSVNMRGLGKDANWSSLNINFMNASIVLIKYCYIATQTMIETIIYKNNMYKLEGFEEYFVNSSECQQYLVQLETDVAHYKKLLDHLLDKFPKEFNMNTQKEQQV